MVRSRQISNPSKLLCMLSLPASMKRIRSRTANWGFFRRLRAANSAVSGPIRLKFKLAPALVHVIVTCNYERERMKNSREKLETPFFPSYPYLLPWEPVVESGRISNSFKLSCMLSLPASVKRIRLRTAEKKWRHHFSHYKPMGIFSDFQGQLTPQSVVQSSRNSNSSELSCMS